MPLERKNENKKKKNEEEEWIFFNQRFVSQVTEVLFFDLEQNLNQTTEVGRVF